MRFHLSLGHLRLDLTICEDDEPEGCTVIESNAVTEIAPEVFGFGVEEDE